jgi:hypothetical protein
VWAALECFAGPEVRNLLNGPAIDGLHNVIPLQHDHYNAFGKFELWFTKDTLDVTPFAVLFNLVES